MNEVFDKEIARQNIKILIAKLSTNYENSYRIIILIN